MVALISLIYGELFTIYSSSTRVCQGNKIFVEWKENNFNFYLVHRCFHYFYTKLKIVVYHPMRKINEISKGYG